MVNDVEDKLNSAINLSQEQLLLEFRRVDEHVGNLEEELNEQRTWYQFNADGATIGKDGNPLQITISNEQISFLESGSATAWVNGQMMYIRSLHILESIIIGHHQFIKYDGVQKSTLLKPTGSGEI